MKIKDRIIAFLKEVEVHGATDISAFSKEELENFSIARLCDRIRATGERSVLSRFDDCAGHFGINDIVLVGESPGGVSPLQKTYPFCGLDGSSKWQNNLLDSEKIPESNLFWVNAYDGYGKPNDPLLVKNCLSATVIALGNKASEWCDENGVEHLKTYHPQYWKRFRSTERYPLLDLIKQNTF